MENQVYNWFVKNGNILIEEKEDYIALELDYENGESCLLTSSDNDEIIQLLTKIAKGIWENPNYVKKPYANQLYQKIENEYFWKIDTAKFLIRYNDIENAIEIKSDGSNKLNVEINYIVEIIQILEHLKR